MYLFGSDSAGAKTMSEPFENFGAYLRDNPLAYAGYRVMFLRKNNVKIPERSTLPLLRTPAFPVVLLAYFLYRNVQYAVSRLRGKPSRMPPVDDDTHLFVVNSTEAYRSKSLEAVAESIDNRDGGAVLYCSPSTSGKRDEWRENGFSVMSHRETHERLCFLRLLPLFARAVRQTVDLYRNVPRPVPLTDAFLVLNLVFLEHAKSGSLGAAVSGTPTVHTVKNSAYLWPHADEQSFYVYQEGIAWSFQDRDTGFPDDQRPFITQAPFHRPATYLIWSEVWRENFEASAHDDSEVVPVGSPYYDWLREEQQQDDDCQTDTVLFIGASQDATSATQNERYEALLRETATVVEEMEKELVIKPHPADDIKWYERRGFGEHLQSFSSIVEALQHCDVAATNASSAFVESSVLETPIVVRDLFGLGLARLGPIKFVSFAETDAEYAEALSESGSEPAGDASSEFAELVRTGNSTARIVELIR